jgi:hypothetical protein
LKSCPETHGAAVDFLCGLRQFSCLRGDRIGLWDVNEHVGFQGDGGANGLSATQADMTPLHALDHIRQSVNGSTDRTTRAGIGQFLTPAAIAQFMASLFEGGPRHARLLDPGGREGPGT